MRTRRLSILSSTFVVLVMSLVVASACGKDKNPGGPSSSTTTTTTTTTSVATTGTLTVAIDGSCNNRGGIVVSVDGSNVGTVQPNASVDRTLSIGNHTVSAVSGDNSLVLNATTVNVVAAGTRFTISCPVATSSTLTVALGSSCNGRVTSGADIFLDGAIIGGSFVGNPLVRSGVSFGTHTLAARERNLTAAPTTVNIQTAAFTFTFNCQ